MKRLITCSDGTWNKPGVKSNGHDVRTNVQKIFEVISKRDESNGIYQMKYYDEGVGAQGNFMTRLFNGATGEGIEENITECYKFLIWNYEPGDEIYLFGFSRGAYTARSLAGLIHNSGILKNADLKLIRIAYAIYRNRNPKTGPDSDLARKFKEENCYTINNIKFIGVWDTVGALGIPLNGFQLINKTRYAFHDTTLSRTVDYAYHALSIDEKRKNFTPTLWEQSDEVVAGEKKQILEQKWFAGVHSNVGGGYPDEGLSDIALKWMISKAEATGLVFDKKVLANMLKPDCKGQIYNSFTFPYNLIGRKYIRPIAKGKNTYECIDETAFERYHHFENYRPYNLSGFLKQ